MSTTPVPNPVQHAASLTERYVHAVTRHLSEEQRDDVANELRASIADRIDALTDERPDLERVAAERAALEELGDPDRLAAGYAGRRLQLIGPDLYPAYVRVLIALLASVVPVVTIVLAVLDAIDGASVGAIVGGAAWMAFTVSIQVAFWVTVAFALVERGVCGDGGRSTLEVEWTPERLPEPPTNRGSLGDLIPSLVWLGLLGAATVWQQFRSPVQSGDERLPILDPDLWSFWLPLILVLLVAEMAFEIVKYRAGSWTFRLATVNVVLGAAFAAPLVYLAGTDQLLNPAAVAAIQEDWSGFDVGTANSVIVLAALLIWAWDSVDGWRKALAT